jgi:chemotaxis protein methyltransferase CheR
MLLAVDWYDFCRYINKECFLHESGVCALNEITDKEFQAIRTYIKKNYGINLSDEKKSLVYSRLRMVLQNHGFENFTQYYEYLVADKTGVAATNFIDKMTTNHTFFMREADHFEYFKQVTLPFVEQSSSTKDLRLWCAASSSGEEPYTLQMIIEDYFSGKAGWDTQTLATDISTSVLEKATAGIYTIESTKPLSLEWKNKYFKKFDDEHLIVNQELKKKLIFRKFNLMSPQFSFKKKFHVIFVRNVMIYFDNVTRDALVDKFYDVMEDGGFLFIGHSESLNHTKTRFKYVKPAIYRKL